MFKVVFFRFETGIRAILALINRLILRVGFSRCLQVLVHWCGFHAKHWAAATIRLRASHQTWPSNRPDLSSVDYRLLRVIQECVYQKQQGTSNIVDELWLLTKRYFINRMTYYIAQGKVETPISIGGQLCCSSVANLFQYLYTKNYQNTMQLDEVIAKIKGCNFFAPQCTNSQLCCAEGRQTILQSTTDRNNFSNSSDLFAVSVKTPKLTRPFWSVFSGWGTGFNYNINNI